MLNPHKSKLTLAVLLLLATTFTTRVANGARQERLIDTWKPLDYSISITLNRGLNEITRAKADISIAILKARASIIDLDFGDLAIDAVLVNGRRARFNRKANSLIVQLPRRPSVGSRLIISVSYHGKPKDGLVLTNDKDGKPSAVGDNWPNRVHHWIPALDHPSAKATVSFSITAPTENIVVANGQLVKVQASAMTRTWTYSERIPIPPYCMIFTAGQFAEVKAEDQSITPLTYFVPKSDQAIALKGFSAAAPSLKIFAEIVAPYPYEKLALIVGATQFGGMENSSAIVFPSNVFSPRANQAISPTFGVRNSLVRVVAHEIAHQWFGDSVTESTWSDLWLSEGFATYFAGVFVQRHEGETAFKSYMKEAADDVFRFEQQQRIPLHDKNTENLFKLLNANNYQKGAWVLHMLRQQLGDKAFFSGIRNYYLMHKDGVASSDDLRSALESASQTKLDAFFASWVYGTGHPVYDVDWNWDEQGKLLQVRLRQSQSEPAFQNWLPIQVTTSAGSERIMLKPTTKESVQEFPMATAPTSVVVDPDNTVLKEVTVRRS
jgi:aminopeptidase N